MADPRAVLEQLYERGHWDWPTMDGPTRAYKRREAVDTALAALASPGVPAPQAAMIHRERGCWLLEVWYGTEAEARSALAVLRSAAPSAGPAAPSTPERPED